MRTDSKSVHKVLVGLLVTLLGLHTAVYGQENNKQENNKKQRQKSSAADSNKQAAATTSDSTAGNDYVIGPDDVLIVNVWKEPELSRPTPVRPDGMITLPLIGDIKAAGNTTKQLQETIKQKLAAYVPSAEVTVALQEVRSQKFNIVGQVARPGMYPLMKPMTVLDAIAVAGGFRDFAKTKKIYVLRNNADGTQARLPFNYNDVIKGTDMRQNVELQAHDTVVVP